MSIPATYWKWFLTETATGLCYYFDAAGNLQTGNIMIGQDFSLPEEPQGWEEIEISYVRNPTYWGVNRSFSIPLKFVGDGARIIRKLFLQGRGTEQPITAIVCKYDERVGMFMPYYKAIVDLTQNVNEVTSGVTVNLIEGGILQLLKSYENTIIELPCNGSIRENVKVLCDGIKFNDVFHYQILKLTSPYPGIQALPCTFISNEGNNIGIIHGDQQLEQPYDNYQQKSSNFIFSSSSTPTTVRIAGSISIKSDPAIHNTGFFMYAATSLSQPVVGGGTDHAVGLVNPQAGPKFFPNKSQFNVDGQRTFSFDASITLQPSENLFIFFFNDFAAHPIQILGGSFSLGFSSQLAASRVWGIPIPDAWKLIGQALCTLASTTDYPFNFLFTSNLLESRRRFILTSGDAVRASTNPNYFQYYNLATLNPQNPNNTDYNQFTTRGPVIKLSIATIFGFINPVACAALGNQPDSNGNDSIFLEDRVYVLNPNTVTVSLPQVNNFRISPDTEHLFNWLSIGYPPNDYDETSGKYEYNNISQYQAAVKALVKKLEIISKDIRTDSNGFELTRYNTQGGKSSTFNQNDSAKWALNTNTNITSPDYYKSYYLSSIQNTTSATNTNILLERGLNYQPIDCGIFDGDYFVNGNDFAIFMLNQPTPGTMNIVANFTALLNGLPGDSAIIKMYINGTVVKQWSQVITGTNTPFNGTFTINRVCLQGDSIWFTIDTIKTCTTTITSFSVNAGAGYFICSNAAPITVQAGSTQQLISLPVITATTLVVDGNTIQVVSYGFQYFRFLSNVYDTNFNWKVIMSGFVQEGPAETMTFTLWKNGIKIGEVTYNGSAIGTVQAAINAAQAAQFSSTDQLNNYDMYWVTASCTNFNAWISFIELDFECVNIKAIALLREAYSSVSGIPNPEWAFNIPDFTPARMLRANGRYLRSCLYMIGNEMLSFQTADKNQFVSTTLNGVTIQENASVDLHSLGEPYNLPLIFEFDTQIDAHAKDIFDAAANGYVAFVWKNKTYYGFPMEIKIKPAYNESQTWRLLAAATNNLADLVDLDWDGILPLQNMDTTIPYINPLHFVPLNPARDPRYNTVSMDEDWFVNRIKDYVGDKKNYYAPWQTNDTIFLQCQTAGLSPVTIQPLNEKGQPIGAVINCGTLTSPSIPIGQTAYYAAIALNAYAEGIYYFLWTMGVGVGMAQWISEPISVKKVWPKTKLLEYGNNRNKLYYIFNATNVAVTPSIRVPAQINKFTPKSTFKTFVNEPQDIIMLNGIPYDAWNLQVGFGSGEPDYQLRKVDRIMLLNNTTWDGVAYTREIEAEMDITYVDGQAKGYGKLTIRKAKNSDGVTLNTLGQIEGPQQAGYVLNAQAFGTNNNGQNIIQVS